jgi:hypothetical protein
LCCRLCRPQPTSVSRLINHDHSTLANASPAK